MSFPKPSEIIIDPYEHQKAEIIRLLQKGNGICTYKRVIPAKLVMEMMEVGWKFLSLEQAAGSNNGGGTLIYFPR